MAFHAWRDPFALVDDRRREALQSDLGPIALFDEPRWSMAASGDAGSAIGITVEKLWDDRIADVRRDLILSALWACAAAGDPAAGMLLNLMRERILKQAS